MQVELIDNKEFFVGVFASQVFEELCAVVSRRVAKIDVVVVDNGGFVAECSNF